MPRTRSCSTTLRNVIGQHILDEILRARDQINQALAEIVDRLDPGRGD